MISDKEIIVLPIKAKGNCMCVPEVSCGSTSCPVEREYIKNKTLCGGCSSSNSPANKRILKIASSLADKLMSVEELFELLL